MAKKKEPTYTVCVQFSMGGSGPQQEDVSEWMMAYIVRGFVEHVWRIGSHVRLMADALIADMRRTGRLDITKNGVQLIIWPS